MLSKLFKDLIVLVSKLPGIGPRQATRIVFWLSNSKEFMARLSKSLVDFHEHVKICCDCFLPFDTMENPHQKQNMCNICSNPRRDNIIAIIEKETDALSMEESGVFKGKYFVLGGRVSALRKAETTIRLKELKDLLERMMKENKPPKELIIATSTTAEGELTAYEVKKIVEKFSGLKVTRLGRGVPIGGEIEFVDPETLKESFEGRK